MPPPFFPQTEAMQSPLSPARFSMSDSQMPAIHHPRPTADGLVFGGFSESQSASPAPYTPPANAQFQSSSSHYARTMAENVNAPPFFPGTTMAPFSDPQAVPSYTPQYAVPAQFSPYGSLPPWMAPVPGFQYPITGAAPPNFSQPISPSLSQHSSTKVGHERPGSHQEDAEPATWQQYPPTQFYGLPNGVLSYSPLLEQNQNAAVSTLTDYLLPHVGKPDYADCTLRIYDSAHPDKTAFANMPAHRLLLARSPLLAAEMSKAAPEKDFSGLPIVPISVPFKLVGPTVISEPIRHLYGNPIQAPVPTELASLPSYVAQERLEQAFGSFIMGSELQIPEFTRNEQDTIKLLLRWDTIEEALSLLSSSRQAAHHNKPSLETNGVQTSGTRTDNLSFCANKLAQYVAEFLSANFPTDFSLDGAVAELADAPRLPPKLATSKPSISNPRLSRIQFGEVQAEESSADHEINTLLSRFLLSLPSEDLSALLASPLLLSRLGPAKQTEVMLPVVQERERRRLKAVKASKITATEKGQLYDNLYLEESAESDPQNADHGIRLVCRRVSQLNSSTTSK